VALAALKNPLIYPPPGRRKQDRELPIREHQVRFPLVATDVRPLMLSQEPHVQILHVHSTPFHSFFVIRVRKMRGPYYPSSVLLTCPPFPKQGSGLHEGYYGRPIPLRWCFDNKGLRLVSTPIKGPHSQRL